MNQHFTQRRNGTYLQIDGVHFPCLTENDKLVEQAIVIFVINTIEASSKAAA